MREKGGGRVRGVGKQGKTSKILGKSLKPDNGERRAPKHIFSVLIYGSKFSRIKMHFNSLSKSILI